MSSTTALECHACHYPLVPGQALLVTPRTGNPPPAPFVVHRVQLVAGCIRAAGRSSDAAIALYAPAAALDFDRANAGDGPRDNGATFEAQARARNAAISAGRPRYELKEVD